MCLDIFLQFFRVRNVEVLGKDETGASLLIMLRTAELTYGWVSGARNRSCTLGENKRAVEVAGSEKSTGGWL